MPAVRNELIFAVDVGAGSLRAGLVRADGRVAAAHAVPLDVIEPRAGWCEFAAGDWWTALGKAASRVLRALPHARVVGICVCGLTRTQVPLDRNGRPVGRAILFRDRRAGFDAAARLAWIERHQPARFARIAKVVEPKDYLAFRLTGEHAAPGMSPWQQVGVVEALPALRGVPVFAGAMDTWASAMGAGAVHPGQGYDVAGTSEAVGLVVAQRVKVQGLACLPWTEQAFHVGGPTQAGADCARWCHHVIRVAGTLDNAVERAGRVALRAGNPLFLPYLAGERAPVWSSEVRGAFHRVDRASTPDAFLRAVMEGVAFAVRDIMELAQSAGTRAVELRVAGGGARSDAWNRIKADVTGLPVIRSAETETGVVGAAMAAAVGLHMYAGMNAAARAMTTRTRTFLPRRASAPIVEARAREYRLMKQAALAMSAK
jgi:xylulokinase